MPYTWSPGWMEKVGAGSWGWGGSQQQHKEDRLFFAFEIENYHTKYLRQQFFLQSFWTCLLQNIIKLLNPISTETFSLNADVCSLSPLAFGASRHMGRQQAGTRHRQRNGWRKRTWHIWGVHQVTTCGWCHQLCHQAICEDGIFP